LAPRFAAQSPFAWTTLIRQLRNPGTIKRLIVVEVGPQSCWTGTVSVIPAATAAPIGCSRRVMFRNWANSAGTVAKRAALTVNGPTCVSRDRDEPHPTQRHGSSGLSDPVEAYEVRRADLQVAGYI